LRPGDHGETPDAQPERSNPPHVLIVDDDASLRADLAEYLTDQGFRCDAADSAETMRAMLRGGLRPDLIVLDVMLPGATGLEAARQLRESSDVGVLMLTHLDGGEHHLAGLRSGADAFLPKTADLDLIEATLRGIYRRLAQPVASPSEAGPLASLRDEGWSLDPATWTLVTPAGKRVGLTMAEKGFLSPLMANRATPVDRTTLVRAMGKEDSETNRRNLDTLARRLRRKVESQTGTPLPLASVYGEGYVFTGG
jgi:DNA-binding response OmpR family regulator